MCAPKIEVSDADTTDSEIFNCYVKLHVEDEIPINYLEGKVDDLLCTDPNLVILPFDEFRKINKHGQEEKPQDVFDQS